MIGRCWVVRLEVGLSLGWGYIQRHEEWIGDMLGG